MFVRAVLQNILHGIYAIQKQSRNTVMYLSDSNSNKEYQPTTNQLQNTLLYVLNFASQSSRPQVFEFWGIITCYLWCCLWSNNRTLWVRHCLVSESLHTFSPPTRNGWITAVCNPLRGIRTPVLHQIVDDNVTQTQGLNRTCDQIPRIAIVRTNGEAPSVRGSSVTTLSSTTNHHSVPQEGLNLTAELTFEPQAMPQQEIWQART